MKRLCQPYHQLSCSIPTVAHFVSLRILLNLLCLLPERYLTHLCANRATEYTYCPRPPPKQLTGDLPSCRASVCTVYSAHLLLSPRCSALASLDLRRARTTTRVLQRGQPPYIFINCLSPHQRLLTEYTTRILNLKSLLSTFWPR